MLSWILCVVGGAAIGLYFAALAKKDKTKDYTAIFTKEDSYIENRMDALYDRVKKKFSLK
jgi:hypothetical protein